MCYEYLFENKFLVYEFDYIYMTALHWSCKRGNIEISKILIEHKCDIDSEDMIGRTPLYFAVYN